MTFVGILVGSVIFGFFADFRGRRTGYLVSTLIIAIVGLLCTASQNIETLIALRAVVGLGLGGVTCSFTLLSEMVGNQHRGKKVILSMGALWTFGGEHSLFSQPRPRQRNTDSLSLSLFLRTSALVEKVSSAPRSLGSASPSSP